MFLFKMGTSKGLFRDETEAIFFADERPVKVDMEECNGGGSLVVSQVVK